MLITQFRHCISRVTVRTLPSALLAVLLLLAGSACVTQQELMARRIQSKYDMFQRLDPATQQRLRQGQVAVGDTAEMAWIALGPPRRTSQRLTAAGTSEVWVYTTTDTRFVTVAAASNSVHHDHRDGRRCSCEPVLVETTETTEYDTQRIELMNNTVFAVETFTPPVH